MNDAKCLFLNEQSEHEVDDGIVLNDSAFLQRPLLKIKRFSLVHEPLLVHINVALLLDLFLDVNYPLARLKLVLKDHRAKQFHFYPNHSPLLLLRVCEFSKEA